MRLACRVVLGIILLGSFCTFLSQAQDIEENLKCLGCHENVLIQETIYKHSPFIQQNCIICHLTPEESPEDTNHENKLSSPEDLGIDRCYNCHPNEKLGVSHPVGVYPSERIQIPEELPMGADNKLLCITCHIPHGSDEEYLGRKPVSAQLCITCHGIDYYE